MKSATPSPSTSAKPHQDVLIGALVVPCPSNSHVKLGTVPRVRSVSVSIL